MSTQILATPTHCPYCAMQCGMLVAGPRSAPTIAGNPEFPVNRGALCVKGWSAAATLDHVERLRTPLVRDEAGQLVPASWPEALARVAAGVAVAQARGGRDAVGVLGGGSLTNEKAYLLGKFARVALGTPNIDYNGRFCMSSAAAAATMALGIDRGLPFPLDDIAHTQAILLVGSNIAETMPPLMQYFERQQANGGRLIVVDPRRSSTAAWAACHLALRPGSDTALANGLLHILLRDDLIDADYIHTRTEDFDLVRGMVSTYWPERVEQLTGISEASLTQAAHILGAAQSCMILTARGAEQHAQGVNNVLAYINVALALGRVGRPFSGFGTITGQGNGQGGREHGQKSDQLPGYRRLDDPAARRHIAGVWNIDEAELPGCGCSAYELLDSIGREDGIRALVVMGTNPVVSAPNAAHVSDRIASLDFLTVADFFLSETAALADVVLPSAQWAEEEGTMTNLEGRVILRRRAFEPPDDIRTDIEILCGLARALGRREGFSFANAREVFDELRRATAGGIADYAGMTYERLEAHNGLAWPCPEEDHPGTPRLFTASFPTASGRARFHAVRHQPAAEEPDAAYPLYLTTGRVLAQYQSGTQTRRVTALTSLAAEAVAELHPSTARRYQAADGDKRTFRTRRGSATFTVRLTDTIRRDTVFVPFHWSGEQSVNRLTNPALDPISRMPEFKVCAVQMTGPSGNRSENAAVETPERER